jgi:hypothetical protein
MMMNYLLMMFFSQALQAILRDLQVVSENIPKERLPRPRKRNRRLMSRRKEFSRNKPLLLYHNKSLRLKKSGKCPGSIGSNCAH